MTEELAKMQRYVTSLQQTINILEQGKRWWYAENKRVMAQYIKDTKTIKRLKWAVVVLVSVVLVGGYYVNVLREYNVNLYNTYKVLQTTHNIDYSTNQNLYEQLEHKQHALEECIAVQKELQ